MWVETTLEIPLKISMQRFSSAYKYGPMYILIRDGLKEGEEIIPRISTIPGFRGHHSTLAVPRTGGPDELMTSKWDSLRLALGFCLSQGWSKVLIQVD